MTECFVCGEIGHTGCVREWKARSDLNVLRAEAAEARIAAALDELDPTIEDYEPYLRVNAVRRALTGGTE